MFKCTCKTHTCKEEYKTELARNRHQAGVLAAKTKQREKAIAKAQAKKGLLPESFRDKPITSKTKSGKGHENWSEVAKRAARTRKRNIISKKLFGKKYKELSLDDKQKVDTELQDEITPEPITKDEKRSSGIGPQKAYMSGRLAMAATKLRILEIDDKDGAPKSQFVEFEGEGCGESNGIIDLLSIKKNRNEEENKKHGLDNADLLDIVHIQVKGGSSKDPAPAAIRRMKKVSNYYNCRETLLSRWNPAIFNVVKFYRLNPQNEWDSVDEKTIFGKLDDKQ